MTSDGFEASKNEDNIFVVDLYMVKQLECISFNKIDKSFIFFSEFDIYFIRRSFSISIF